jgi:hypothetical protein
LPVARLGSGAYSAKLLAGTRQRLSGLSQPRQCGDVVLRILVTGGPPVRGACRSLPQQWQLSLCNPKVSFHISVFEACSTFSRIIARTLAQSLNDPFHRRLQTGRCLPACSDCYRLERPLPGRLAPSQELCLSTAHDHGPPTDLVMPAHPGEVPAESFSARAFSVGRLRPRAVQADGAGGQ